MVMKLHDIPLERICSCVVLQYHLEKQGWNFGVNQVFVSVWYQKSQVDQQVTRRLKDLQHMYFVATTIY